MIHEWAGLVQAIHTALQRLAEDMPHEAAYERLAPHRGAFVSVCVNALKQLEAEGIFGRGTRRHKTLVSFLAGEIYHEAYLQYGLDLNPPTVIEGFLAEMVAAAQVSEVIQENMWRSAQM